MYSPYITLGSSSVDHVATGWRRASCKRVGATHENGRQPRHACPLCQALPWRATTQTHLYFQHLCCHFVARANGEQHFDGLVAPAALTQKARRRGREKEKAKEHNDGNRHAAVHGMRIKVSQGALPVAVSDSRSLERKRAYSTHQKSIHFQLGVSSVVQKSPLSGHLKALSATKP